MERVKNHTTAIFLYLSGYLQEFADFILKDGEAGYRSKRVLGFFIDNLTL
jgi:hypothetical protein